MEVAAPLSQPLARRQRRWSNRSRTGCATCRTRRVKCDEEKPVCKRCFGAGVACKGLGYSQSVQSTNKQLLLAPKPVHSRAHERSIARAPPSVPHLNASIDVRDLLGLVPQMSRYVSDTFMNNPANVSVEHILFGGQQMSLFLEFLPSRLGYNETLDKAITSVVDALRDICLPEGTRSPVKTLGNYAQALKLMQRSLADPEECLSAEVLCAVHLLGIFETLRPNGTKTTQAHRQGVYRLYQLRGPQRFRTDFEHALLISQTPMMISDLGFCARRCFLDHPKWLTAIKTVSGLKSNNFHLSEYCISRFQFMIPIGRVNRDCHYIVMNQNSGLDLEEMRRITLDDVASQRKTVQTWVTRWDPILYPRKDEESVYLGKGDSEGVRESIGLIAKTFTMAYIRFHIAIGGERALELENIAVSVARELAEGVYSQDDATAAFDVMFAKVASRGILESTEEWQRQIEKTGGGKPIEPAAWYLWLYKWGVNPD